MAGFRNSAVMLIPVLATTAYGQEEPKVAGQRFDIHYCQWMSVLGRDVMTARQDGRPKTETLSFALTRLEDVATDVIKAVGKEEGEDVDAVSEPKWDEVRRAFAERIDLEPTINQMVTGAYEWPKYSYVGFQERAISRFAEDVFGSCLEPFKALDSSAEQ